MYTCTSIKLFTSDKGAYEFPLMQVERAPNEADLHSV
jgi:hypothetical protein